MDQEHEFVNRLEFLPYHFLLVSVNRTGMLRYQVQPGVGVGFRQVLAKALASRMVSSPGCWRATGPRALPPRLPAQGASLGVKPTRTRTVL